MAALARANRISTPDHLPAGTVLRVPGGDVCVGPPRARNASSRPAAAGGGAGPALHREVTDLLARATAHYDGADFEEALSLAQAGIATLAPHPSGAETDALRARCHTVSGMAAAGLGQRERAIAEFRQALAFAPDLPLDPERSSPRVLELVEAARAGSAVDEAPHEPFVDSSTR